MQFQQLVLNNPSALKKGKFKLTSTGTLPNARLSVKTRNSPPAILHDKRWGEHKYLKLENGIKIHYVEKGDSNKPLMLFLHGYPEFWFCWRHQLEHFSKNYW